MLSATNKLDDLWAALELEVSEQSDQPTSEWLISLRIVMTSVERALQKEGRGAYIFIVTPHGALRTQSDAAPEAAPPATGRPTPPAA
jgi:hypothetical protein